MWLQREVTLDLRPRGFHPHSERDRCGAVGARGSQIGSSTC
jgi:hypothetical protein